MGRSKQARSPIASPGTGTPKLATPTGNQLKVEKAIKRPLPSDSDEEEDDEIAVADVVNGVPNKKKGKFMPNDASDEDDDDTDEDDEDDDDESDEDSAADVANGLGSDDDDDEEDDEDDDEEDDEEDEDSEDGERAKPMKTEGKLKEKPIQKPIQPTAAGDHEYLLIPTFPKDIPSLKQSLTDRGYSVENLQQFLTPVAIATVSSVSDAKKLATAEKPFSVDGNTVHFLHLVGSKDALKRITSGNVTNTLFLTGIPKGVTSEFLQSKLKGDKPVTVKILSSGPKNKLFNAAFMQFANAPAATAALTALSNAKFDNRNLRVTYARESSDTNETRLRGETKSLLASQLPPSVTEDRLRAVFTTAVNLKMITRKDETICFIDFASPTEAVEAFDAHHNSHIGKSKVMLRFVPTRDNQSTQFSIDVGDVPLDTPIPQLLAIFPGATSAKQNRNNEHTIIFPTDEVRRSAIKGTKKLANKVLTVSVFGGFNRNIGWVKNLPFDASKEEVHALFPEASAVTIDIGSNQKATGFATIEFPNTAICEAALNKRKTLKNRPLLCTLKRVIVSPIQQSVETQKPKNKLQQKQQKVTLQPPQVGSGSEDEDDEEESGSDEEESMDEDEEEDDDVAPAPKVAKKSKQAKVKTEEDDEEEEDSDDEDEEDESEEDDEEEDGDDGSEDEGIDDASDDEPPTKVNKQFSRGRGGDRGVGFKRGGDRGFERGGRGGGGFRGRGRGGSGDGERGFHRGGGGDRGFKRGGDRGFGRGGRGGDRGSRGGFKPRGRGGSDFKPRGRGRFNGNRGGAY